MTDEIIHAMFKGSGIKSLTKKPMNYKKMVEILIEIKIRTAKKQKIDLAAKALDEMEKMKAALDKIADKFPKGELTPNQALKHYSLCESDCKFLKPSDFGGVVFYETWFVNLALILHFKKIESDAENGWQITPVA